MSKSYGNVIDPYQLKSKYPLEAIRLYFLIEGPYQKDINFSEDLLENLYNSFIDKIGKIFY